MDKLDVRFGKLYFDRLHVCSFFQIYHLSKLLQTCSLAVLLVLHQQRQQLPVQLMAVPVFIGDILAAGIQHAEIAGKFP